MTAYLGTLRQRREGRGWSAACPYEAEPWPQKTDTYCWWCRHAYDSVPIPLPIEHNDRTDTFHVRGKFCSWSCAKAFSANSHDARWSYWNQLLHMLHRRCCGRSEPIRAAPHWSSLRIFGGNLSIEDFRARCQNDSPVFDDQRILYMGFSRMHLTTTAAVAPSNDVKKETSQQPRAHLTVSEGSSVKSEPLKLRRTKPLPGKTSNVLEKILGITAA
jgi:hypothetical protein